MAALTGVDPTYPDIAHLGEILRMQRELSRSEGIASLPRILVEGVTRVTGMAGGKVELISATERSARSDADPAVELGRPRFLHRDSADHTMGEWKSPSGSQALLRAPLRLDGEVGGWLTVWSGDRITLDETDLRVVEILCDLAATHVRQKETLENEALLSRQDALTGVGNRRSYDEQIVTEVARARRSGTPLALCLIDIDDFKPINDHFGHPAGDDVLRRIAAAIAGERESDKAFRLGGDEFAVLLGDTDQNGAEAYAERLAASIASLDLGFGTTTISVGAASGSGPPEDLHAAADHALYQVKAGKNLNRPRAARTESRGERSTRWEPLAVPVARRSRDLGGEAASSDYFDAIANNMYEGLFALDRDGRVLYANPAAEKLLGWKQHELKGASMRDLRADRNEIGEAGCPVRRVSEGGKTARDEEELFICRDGRELDVVYTAAPIQRGGRGFETVVMFTDNSERRRREEDLARQKSTMQGGRGLRRALEQGDLEIHLQPVLCARTGRLQMLEVVAAVRDRGAILFQDQFMPLAEEFDFASEIDFWVIDRAAEVAAAGKPVSVNLSRQTIRTPGVIERLSDSFASRGADPGVAVLEIDEGTARNLPADVRRFSHAARQAGFRLALDDLGTGSWGAASYPEYGTFDFLKLGRSYGAEIGSTSSDEVISAVVKVAGSLGQTTIVQGVDDPARVDSLAALGIDCIQGSVADRQGVPGVAK